MITLENDRRFLYDCSSIIREAFEDDDGYGDMYNDKKSYHGGKYSGQSSDESSILE